MSFVVSIKYIESVTGNEVGYSGSFSSKAEMHERLSELKIDTTKITSLQIKKNGEQFKNYNPTALRG